MTQKTFLSTVSAFVLSVFVCIPSFLLASHTDSNSQTAAASSSAAATRASELTDAQRMLKMARTRQQTARVKFVTTNGAFVAAEQSARDHNIPASAFYKSTRQAQGATDDAWLASVQASRDVFYFQLRAQCEELKEEARKDMLAARCAALKQDKDDVQ